MRCVLSDRQCKCVKNENVSYPRLYKLPITQVASMYICIIVSTLPTQRDKPKKIGYHRRSEWMLRLYSILTKWAQFMR